MKRIKKSLDDRIVQDYEKEISAMKNEEEKLTADRGKLQAEIDKLSVLDNNIEVRLEQIRDLKEHMANLEGDELKDLRLSLRSKIRDFIDTIKVFPKGRVNMNPFELKDRLDAKVQKMVVQRFKKREAVTPDHDSHDPLTYEVLFKGGAVRVIHPKRSVKLTWDHRPDGYMGL